MDSKEEKAPGPAGMLVLGLVMSAAGVAMAVNLLSGKAEFVHGPRTNHWLVSLLGESCLNGQPSRRCSRNCRATCFRWEPRPS